MAEPLLRDILVRALTGLVFMEPAANERIADRILTAMRADPETVDAITAAMEAHSDAWGPIAPGVVRALFGEPES